MAGIKGIFLFLGTAHVPTTLFFYTDKEFSGIIRNHRFRYIFVPIFLTVSTGLLFAFWRVADLKQMELIKGSGFYMGVADFLLGAVLGATMSHFVVDAGVWKLSMARQRDYITKRFDFIFKRFDFIFDKAPRK